MVDIKKGKKTTEKPPDITERKRAEETSSRLATVVRDSNDAIIIQEIDGRITAWNRGAELMYGYSEAEALGMNIEHLSPPDKVSEQREFTRRLIAGEAVTSFETQRITKDGGILDVWLTVTKLVEDPADIIISTGRDVSRPIGIALIERNITLRKKAEEELKQSEQNFKSITENAHDGIIVALRNGACIYTNRRASEITGYHINEILKTGIEGLAHPDEKLKLSERRKKILAGENVPNQYETAIIHKDGNIRLIEITFAKTLWYGQKADIFVFRDITERKRMTEALEKSEEYFKEITENSSDIIIVTDKNGDIKYCSNSIERFTGYKPEEIIGESAFKFILTDDVQHAVDAFGKAILTKDIAVHNTFRLMHKDGSVHFVDGLGRNLLDDPSVAGFIMNIHDVTKRKQAEEALRESEVKYSTLVENATEGVVVVQDGLIKFANRSMSEIYGYSVEELIGMSVFDLVPTDSIPALKDRFALRAEGKDVADTYYSKILCKNGTVKEVESSTKIINYEGKTAALGITRDITERKRDEEALSESEEWHRALVEASGRAGIGVVILQSTGDREAAIVFANEQACSIAGYSQEDLLKMSLGDFLPSDVIRQIMLRYKDRQEGKPVPSYYETVIVNRAQVRIPVITSVAALHLHGKPSTVVYFRNISELKEAEEALHHSEERFRSLVEKSSDVIIIIGRDSTISYVSPTVHTVFNRDPSELLGKSALDFATEFVHQDDVKTVMKAFEGCLETPSAERQTEFRFKLLDGSWLNLEVTGKNLLDNPSIQGLVVNIRDITERKKAEEALQESEEKIRGIFDAIGDSMTVVDMNGKIIELNEAAVRLFGLKSKEAAIGMDSWAFIADEDLTMAKGQMREAILTRQTAQLAQFKYKRLDGMSFYGETSSVALHDTQGNIVGFIAVIRDITERRQLEAALLETEERYKSLFDHSLEAIYIADMNGNFTDANPYALKLLGYEKEEIATLNFSSLVAKESAEITNKISEEITRTGSQKEIAEYKVRKKDGTYAWIETHASLLYKDGKPVGLQGIARDITERKQSETALRESEEKYRLLAENASDVITVMDMNLRPIYMSPSITRLLGYSVEEALARGIEGSLTPKSIKVATKGFTETITKEKQSEKLEPVTIDLEFIRKDGSTVWVSTSVNIIRGSDGQPAEILSILHDITERKRAENALLLYKDHLEELVKERTEELDKAKVIAEQATKAKSEFLSNMSHEIRTPLSTIIGFSELLYDETKGPINDDQKKYLGYVASSGQHLLSLINDILDLSKVEAGKMEMLPTSFSISDLLKNSLSFIAEKAMKHNIRLLSEISADVDTIEADERKVKQILYNLLSNAVKFTLDGGTITIGADIVFPNSTALPSKIRKGLPDTKYVLVSVKDTGIGITKKDQSKLFTEFYQLENPYTKKYEGTGLGLVLSQKLVILHGGKIWFESRGKGKGKGCTFYFILPINVRHKKTNKSAKQRKSDNL